MVAIFSTLPAGHAPTAAELQSITDTLTAVSNSAAYTAPSGISPTVNFTSTSYADFTNAQLAFTKYLGTSSLMARIDVTGFATGASLTCILGVQINGTDYQVSKFLFNELSSHRGWSGTSTLISGVAAASYNIKVRGKIDNTASARTATFDAGDIITLTVWEVP